jgi:uracil-DNA glycosylase
MLSKPPPGGNSVYLRLLSPQAAPATRYETTTGMTHPRPDPSRPDLALKALVDFWDDMGLDEARGQAPALIPSPRPKARQARPDSTQSAPSSGQVSASGRPPPKVLAVNPVADARRAAAAASTITALKAAIETFEGCTLRPGARNTAVFDGAIDADVMIVGEAPGPEEDAAGLPFVGRAGRLLDRMLATIGLSRSQNVYITNLVYWRPPGDRDPSAEEVQVCAPFLARQIQLKRPKLLLSAGKFATQTLLGVDDGIMKVRGRKLRYSQDGLDSPVPCVPLLHPAYLLRQPNDKAKAWDDLLTVAALCDELGIKRGKSL